MELAKRWILKMFKKCIITHKIGKEVITFDNIEIGKDKLHSHNYGYWNDSKIIFMWYQNIFLFKQNKFILNKVYLYDIRIYFHSIKINFCSIRYIYMISKYIFIQSKQIYIQKETFLLYILFSIQLNYFLLNKFFIRYFSSDHIWSSIFICKSQNFTFSI